VEVYPLDDRIVDTMASVGRYIDQKPRPKYHGGSRRYGISSLHG